MEVKDKTFFYIREPLKMMPQKEHNKLHLVPQDIALAHSHVVAYLMPTSGLGSIPGVNVAAM